MPPTLKSAGDVLKLVPVAVDATSTVGALILAELNSPVHPIKDNDTLEIALGRTKILAAELPTVPTYKVPLTPPRRTCAVLE